MTFGRVIVGRDAKSRARENFATALRFVLVGLVTTLVGCALFSPKPPPKLAPPPVSVVLDHFLGMPLSGPRAGNLPATTPDAAMAVQIDLLALRSMPANGPGPLGAQTQLISRTEDGVPVSATAQLTLGVKYALDDDAARRWSVLPDPAGVNSVTMASFPDAVPGGVTSVVTAGDSDAATAQLNGATAAGPRLQIYVSPVDSTVAGPSFRLAVAIDRHTIGPDGADTAVREIALLDPLPVATGHDVLMLVPYSRSGSAVAAFAVHLRIEPGSNTPAQQAALARCIADVQQSSAAAAGQSPLAALNPAESSTLAGALRQVALPARRRAALIYLATQTGAPICQDAALIADDAALARLAGAIAAATAAGGAATAPSDSSVAALAWILDSSTVHLLAALQAEKKLTPELNAVLLRQTGEVGRHDGSIDDIIKAAASAVDLKNRLIAENTIYLEDSSPSSRVRAYDWLAAQGRAPEGYDPLGPPRDRRNALERASTRPAIAGDVHP